MGILRNDLHSLFNAVTKDWRKAKRQQLRTRSREIRLADDRNRGSGLPTFTDVAFEIIPPAYKQVSDGGRLYALCRQLYYETREEFRKRCSKMPSEGHFRALLRQVMQPEWKVAFDPRGNLVEPHTDKRVPLGTIDCDQYADHFPKHCFGGLLFIEKEGFLPLLQDAGILKRYDLAVMGCKGQSVEAARHLIDVLCKDRPLFIVHDFDMAGIFISGALTRNSDVYTFKNEIKATDFGLRLADVERFGLLDRCETLDPKKDAKKIPQRPLEMATAEENAFLMSGRRVELNAFRSADFIRWLEENLQRSGIQKVVPEETKLADGYLDCERRRLVGLEMVNLNRRVSKQMRNFTPPSGLTGLVRGEFADDPCLSWESAVAAVHARTGAAQ